MRGESGKKGKAVGRGAAIAIIIAIIVIAAAGWICLSLFSDGADKEMAKVEIDSIADESISDKPIEVSFDESPSEEEYIAPAKHQATADELWNLPKGSGIFSFALGTQSTGSGDEPAISPEFSESIDAAIADIEATESSAGFLIMDLETGRGYAYNIDQEFYAASSIKGPFVQFVCEEFIETGKASLDGYLSDIIAATITESDNDAYEELRLDYTFGGTFANWLSRLGMDPDSYITGHLWYPDYSVREASVFWLNIWDYLCSGTQTAEWLSRLFAQTNLSPIRDGADNAEIVFNKAGWIGEVGYNAIDDNGIAYIGGTPYLVSILTDLAYSDSNYNRIVRLANIICSHAEDLR